MQVKAHAKHLASEAENEATEKKQAAIGDSAANAQVKKKATSSVQLDSLYDLLYDQNGKSKAQNLNQKVVVRGPTLEILESKGNAISIQASTTVESQTMFENLKWNKSLKIVNQVP